MAPFGTIYSYPSNPRVIKTQAAANINGLEIANGEFTMGQTNLTPEFRAKFPFGKVPAFESADGVKIVESNAITQFVAESGPAASQLLGSTPVERALVRQWVEFADGEVLSPILQLGLWRFLPSKYKYDEANETNSLNRVERSMGHLDQELAGKTWLAGTEKLSLADISVAAAFIWGFALSVDAEMRAKYPNVMAWYERVTESEGVKQAFGEKNFVEKRSAPPS
ncbi:glutathione S-transferase [Aspergillus steynii IBT 23096]|uniref:Glutathione S-transferase n=1 Tax=Aspergillus steynii IBT 23096 TaxID=1392250 RepID=A0A2I2FV51_9EURO|nr:glutathione S-transferase [Aspergillus steynii IBT 23096]PLB44528.1 glutathione S-transferase [Aspergillus steynii IBT 23096]